MKILYFLLLILNGQNSTIEPDSIGNSTIPNSIEINEFLSKNNFASKEIEEEELMMNFYFAHGFNSCWGDCWRNCVWMDTIYSSSQLDSINGITYKAQNVDDFDLRTAWIEGKPDYGLGESLTMSLKTIDEKNVKISRIIFVNGYTKSLKTWENNSRVKEIKLYCNDLLIGTLKLKDTDKYQSFEIGNLLEKVDNIYKLRFEILDIYPGKKFKDTGLSAIILEGEGCG